MDEAFLNDLLECSVCLEQLDSSSKVLPCQHTFCKRCLEEIVNSHKELRCPECRVLVDASVDELPCNILLIRLLEGIKNNPRLRSASLGGEIGSRRPDILLSQNSQILPLLPPTFRPPITRQTSVVTGDGRTMPKQVFQTLPCAKALYPYEAKQPGDLSFKKGDIIILKKRIDQNWYQGELNGKGGFLPASYIQVMVPLPPHLPQCKALYDFCITDSEEKDCLSFSKGDIITVIRRVDDNWIEGKLGERIGIYPISFVEMNAAARALMKLSSNVQGGPSKVAPPTPTTESIQSSNNPPSTGTVSVPASHDSLSSTTTSPSPASSSTSPSPSSSSSSSSSFPSSVPVTTQTTAVVASPLPATVSQGASPVSHTFTRDSFQHSNHSREKRHSFSALSMPQRSPQMPGVHRHSMEILSGVDVGNASNTLSSSPPNQSPCSATSSSTTPSPTQRGESSSARVVRRHSSRRERGDSTIPSSTSQGSSDHTTSGNSTGTQTHVPVPTFYTALYNYKPQKEDELELKKSELYTVSEKCQDGWFKGTSLRTKCSGVFPGNYVQLAKSSGLQGHYHQVASSVANVRSTASKPTGHIASQQGTVVPPRPKPPVAVCTPYIQTGHKQPLITSSTSASTMTTCNPVSSSPSIYAHAKIVGSQEPHTSVLTSIVDWSGHTVTTVSTPQRPPRPQPPSNTSSPVIPRPQASPKLSSSVTNSPANWPSIWVNTSTATPVSNEVMSTALTAMAASYPSPASGTRSSGQTSSSNNSSITQSWHGGMQSRTNTALPHSVLSAAVALTPPNVSIGTTVPSSSVTASSSGIQSKVEKHKERKEKEKISLMKRLTSKRKSKSPPPSNYSCDNPSFVDNVVTNGQVSSATVHVRSGSCPSEALSGQAVNHKKGTDNLADASKTSRPRQPAPLIRERFRCIVPYPPNSEYELELRVGDIVYVHKKREDGWYKGTLQRTGKTGLFPASFVEGF